MCHTLCDDGGTAWLPITSYLNERNATGPAFTSEAELREIRAQCRALALTNEFAINGHENRINYIVGYGHTYRVSTRKGVSTSPDLVAAAQAILDRFLRDNLWQRRQQELVLRCDRDGEAFLRFFTAADGATRVRFVEPAQVTTPAECAASPADSFGIRTDPQDVETVVGYFIDGQFVDAADIQHRKTNVDFNVKRGLPLFYTVRKNLFRAEKLLRNMSAVSEIQSAIALIRRHRNSTRTAIQQFISQQSDTSTQPAARPSNFKRYAPGTILDAHADVDYEFPAAALDASAFVGVLQAELRAVASRLVMPEFMLSSDASNANYASTMVAETPAVRMFERLQQQQIEDDRLVLEHVLRSAMAVGHLPDDALAAITIQAEPPTLAMRDLLQEAQVFQIQATAGILSPQTWSALSGLDYDQEQENLAQARPHSRAEQLEWDAAQHPRDKDGLWINKGGGSGSYGYDRVAQLPPRPTAQEHRKKDVLGERTWKSAEGNFSAKGEYLEIRPDGKVKFRLRDPNGNTRDQVIDPKALSAEDQEIIKGLQAKPDNVKLEPTASQEWKEKTVRDIGKLNDLPKGREIIGNIGETGKLQTIVIGGKRVQTDPVNATVVVIKPRKDGDNKTTFTPGSGRSLPSDVTVQYDPNDQEGDQVKGERSKADRQRPPYIGLGKEMSTANEVQRGRVGGSNGRTVPEEERRSRKDENELRDQHNARITNNQERRLPHAVAP